MLELGIWSFQIMSDESTIHRGLDGVVVDTTRISKVMPEINSLVYAGYPVQELCEHCRFEEVAWLMWHGELPTQAQLADFMAQGRAQRDISNALLAVIEATPRLRPLRVSVPVPFARVAVPMSVP